LLNSDGDKGVVDRKKVEQASTIIRKIEEERGMVFESELDWNEYVLTWGLTALIQVITGDPDMSSAEFIYRYKDKL
jgi:hypothetical protein